MTRSEQSRQSAQPNSLDTTHAETEVTNATGSSNSPQDGPQDFSDAGGRPTIPPQGGNNNKKAPFTDIRVSTEQSMREALNGIKYPLMTSIAISWTIDPKVPVPVSFNCYRDGHLLRNLPFDPKKTTYRAIESSVLPNMDYRYQVFAVDAEDKEYTKSSVVVHTTPSTTENHNLLTRVAGITVRCSDSQGPNVDPKTFQDLLFDGPISMVKYFEEVSYGKVNITGEIYPEITLDFPLSKYQEFIDGKIQSYGDLLYDDIIEAISDLFDITEYDLLIAVVMGYEQTSQTSNITLVEDEDLDLNSITHEIGHFLGCIRHSTYWIGEGGYVGPSVVDIKEGGWKINDYADVIDPMGASSHRHFSPINKSIIGYTDPTQVKTILTPGTYELFAIEVPTTGPVEFRLPFKNVSDKIFYTLEYRKPLGAFDSPPLQNSEGQSTGLVLGNGDLLHGVIIRLRWDNISGNTKPYGTTGLFMPRTMITKEVEFVDLARGITIKVIDYLEPNKVKLSIEGDWY